MARLVRIGQTRDGSIVLEISGDDHELKAFDNQQDVDIEVPREAAEILEMLLAEPRA